MPASYFDIDGLVGDEQQFIATFNQEAIIKAEDISLF